MTDQRLKVVLTLDGKTYEAELDRATQATTKFGQSAKTSSAGLSQMYGQAKQVYGILAAYGALRIVKGFIDINAEFERLTATLTAVEGSSAKAQGTFGALEKLAASTPFQLQQLTGEYIKLKAYGLEPLDGSMQAIIDQSAKLGGSQQTLDGIILAVGQAWARQKLQGQDILQLINQNVPVWELLAKATGKNTNELQKLSEQGKLGRDVIKKLIDEMGKSSFGAAAAQVNTLNGSFSNLQNSIAKAARALGEKSGFNEMLKEAAHSAAGFFNALSGNDKQQALDTFRTLIEPNIAYLKSFGIAMNDLDPTNLERVDRILLAAKLHGVDLEKQAPFSTMLMHVEALRGQYDSLTVARDKVIASYGRESAPAKILTDRLVALDARIKSIIIGYTKLAAGPKAIAAPAAIKPSAYTAGLEENIRAQYTDTEKLNDAIIQQNALWNARLIGTDTYTRSIRTLAGVDKDAAAAHDAYIARLSAAEQMTLDARTAQEVYNDEVIRWTAALERGDIGEQTYIQGLVKAQQGLQAVGDTGKNSFDQLTAAVKGWGDNFTNTLADAVQHGKLNFKSLADSIISDMLRMQIYQGITQPLLSYLPGGGGAGSSSNFFKWAKGGIMSSSGPVPLKRYASGGVATSPQLAMFGEGSQHEAYVPLPDGRRIPVAMSGNNTGQVRVVIENRGAQKEAQQAQASFDPQGMVINVLLDDVRRGGPASGAIAQAYGLQRRV